MGRLRRSFWVLVTALALASVASLLSAEENKPSQDNVAVVNGSVITRADFDRELRHAQGRLSTTGIPLGTSRLTQLKKEVLEQLIERELLYQESQKRGIKVDETAVKKQLETLKKRFPSEAELKMH